LMEGEDLLILRIRGHREDVDVPAIVDRIQAVGGWLSLDDGPMLQASLPISQAATAATLNSAGGTTAGCFQEGEDRHDSAVRL
jgi:hypothetical protein